VQVSIGPSTLDTTVPVLLLKLSQNVMQHGALGIIRSLGRLGVSVYATVEDRLAPAAMSRYLSGAFVNRALAQGDQSQLTKLGEIGERLGRPTILVPTDDSAAIFIANHADALAKWFLFPRVERDLPRQLANKKDLYSLCRNVGVPCPETIFPTCVDDVHEFVERARFPVVVKAPEPHRLPRGVSSVRIAETPKRLLSLYRHAEGAGIHDLFLQEYIPDSCAQDWIFHGYANPKTGSFVAFTGRKLRSYPPFAGSTTLGVSERNEILRQQTQALIGAVRYAGIMDLDYRFDERDGRYKLLDFNPRVGANFRMFADRDGLDVVRAQHLDLTGRTVHLTRGVQDRTFIVEPYDLLATIGYMRRNSLTVREWWSSLKGRKEVAWFSADDPVPFLTMCIRLLLRGVGRLIGKGWAYLRPARATPKPRSPHCENRPASAIRAYNK
jgi:D-aspartate ligase